MSLRYKRLYLDSPSLQTPIPGDAGYDLCAYGDYRLVPGTILGVTTGIAVEIPEGYVGLILPRSGLRFNQHISTYGTGVIDSSYRGELKLLLILYNDYTTEREIYYVRHGDKVAQLVIIPCFSQEVEEVESLSDTMRSSKGFGSTGR